MATQLRDPADEMVVEVAVNGRAEAPVTFNSGDFADVPRTFGVEVISPGSPWITVMATPVGVATPRS